MSVSKFMEKKVFYPGQKVFGEGDEGNKAYLVEKGMIEIAKLTPSGNEKVLGTVTTGGIFGEMALIDDQPRMATARAVQETTCIIISREVFHDKLRKTDPFIQGLLKIFVRNIRNLSQEKMKALDRHDRAQPNMEMANQIAHQATAKPPAARPPQPLAKGF